MRRRFGIGQGPQGRTSIVGATAAMLLLTAVVLAVCGMVARATPAVAGLRRSLGLSEGPTYAVGYLRDELTLQPGVWLGRTVRVYAVAQHVPVRYCPYPVDACVGEAPVLAAAGVLHTAPLPLVWGLSDPLRARLRQLPQIARIVPPQALHWGRTATYRIALRRLPGSRCRTCYAAVLFDASPVAGL